MNRKRQWQTALCVALLACIGSAPGQASLGVSAYLSYTDNLFQDGSKQPEWVTLTYFDLDYAPNPNLNLYYTGSANTFAEYRDLFSHRHQIGIGYARSPQNRNALYAGVEMGARLDRPVYRYYDYLQGDGYLSGKLYLPEGVLSEAGYRLRYRAYLSVGAYSFAEQSAFVQLSRSWQTGTTVRIRGDLGVKTYIQEAAGDFSLGAAGLQEGARTLAQVLMRLKVAQSVAKGTGLQLELLRRVNVTGGDRYAAGAGYVEGENPFDDRYSYGGREIRSSLKHLGVWGMRLEMTGQVAWRNYEDRPALGADGAVVAPTPLRRDRRKSLHFQAEKVFRLSSRWMQEVGLQAEWLYLDVNSNDAYYDVATRVYLIGLRLGF